MIFIKLFQKLEMIHEKKYGQEPLKYSKKLEENIIVLRLRSREFTMSLRQITHMKWLSNAALSTSGGLQIVEEGILELIL